MSSNANIEPPKQLTRKQAKQQSKQQSKQQLRKQRREDAEIKAIYKGECNRRGKGSSHQQRGSFDGAVN